ncbi:MAG: hypothetical protein QOF86_2213 [Baekduia sp.]|nr:hypothetical protein [Baekduia sp.]
MLADAVPYSGQTAEHRRVVVEIRRDALVRVRATLQHYSCATFGEIGPLSLTAPGRARIARDGSFRFVAGPAAQRLTVLGHRRAGGRVTGTLRVHGTIATGQRCASLTVRFTARR